MNSVLVCVGERDAHSWAWHVCRLGCAFWALFWPVMYPQEAAVQTISTKGPGADSSLDTKVMTDESGPDAASRLKRFYLRWQYSQRRNKAAVI